MMDKKQEHYEKVKKILTSCMNRDHLKTAVKVINQFNKQYRIGEYDPEYITLKRLLDLMKVKCGVKTKSYNGGEQLIDEEFFASTKDWEVAASQAGLKDVFFKESEIEKIRSQEIVNKLRDEAKIDTKIPTGQLKVQGSGEHNSPVTTQGTNTTLKKGNAIVSSYKPLEEDEIEGGKADEMTPSKLAKKHRVSVKDIKDEINAGEKIEREHTKSDDLAKEIAMDHIDEYPDYYSNKEYGVSAIEKKLEKFHRKRLKKRDIEEATSGGSAGAFEGPLGGKNIRRTFYKSNVPVSDAGGMLDKPIGKLYSFKKRQIKEANVFRKDEIMNEAVDSDAALGQYDTSGWGNSEFMLTKPKRGKKGKVRVRKGKDYKKTYDYDTGSSTFVKIKDKCKKFPYCVQSPDAIELSKTPFNENKELEKLIEGICKKTGKSKKYVHSLINRYL